MAIENVKKFLEMLREYEDVQTIVGDVLDNREDDDSDAAKILAIADEQDLQFTVGEFLMETAIMDETALDYIAGGYTYGKITITRSHGLVTYTMHNLNTNKIEKFVGKNDRGAASETQIIKKYRQA